MDASTPRAGGGKPSEPHQGLKYVDEGLLSKFSEIFKRYLISGDRWQADQIKTFWHHVQAEDYGTLPPNLSTKHELEFSDFLRYMSSDNANALTVIPDQDLSWPLNNYFISSSHNTYLTGNQLSSDSSTGPYKDVLLRGGRCIEIDVWDGEQFFQGDEGEDGGEQPQKVGKRMKLFMKAAKWASDRFEKPEVLAEIGTFDERAAKCLHIEPRVLHGFTLTKEVSFRDVCETVRDYAFVTSDLPLIVSLEVHCSPIQQAAMVDIMEKAWGEFLLSPDDADTNCLPSPADLRRKILIKVKYVPPNQAVEPPTDSDDTSVLDSEINKQPGNTKNVKPVKMTQELSRLGIYTRGVSFKSFDQPEASMPNHIFSLSESAVFTAHQRSPLQLFNHNRDFLMRTYPGGSRVDSSNFDPNPFWRMGIQMVALNWQEWDEGMMLNEAMFSGTDGYVLKPEAYRSTGERMEITETPNVGEVKLDRLAIHILFAQDIPLSSKDGRPSNFQPYVKVELHTDAYVFAPVKEGETAHVRGTKFRAQTGSKKGTSTDFDGEVLDIQNVQGVIPNMAFVSFVVMNDVVGPDELAAWACIRLDRLKSGFRLVHLMDRTGVASRGVLFVKIEQRFA